MNGPAPAFAICRKRIPRPHPPKSGISLLRPDVELAPAFSNELNARMRAQRLVFGDRIHCPFLRPFFLSAEDEQRVRAVAETIAVLGERVVKAISRRPRLLAQSALSPEEERLARINPRYAPSSTSSRLDAFLLPDSLQFAEYNAESPAGPGYAETLADVFLATADHGAFLARYSVRKYPLMKQLLGRSPRQLSRMGRHRHAASNRHRGLARSPHLERIRNPAVAFLERWRPHGSGRSARSGFENGKLIAQGQRSRSSLSPRPHQRHRRPSRRNVPR